MRARRVEVRWWDAASSRYAEDAGLAGRKTIGWLVKKNRREVRVAQTRDGKRRFEDFMAIPTPNVRSIRDLK